MTSEPAQSAKRILLVDDNCHGLEARRSVLESVGFVVTISCRASEALQLFGSGGSFDLLVTDYRMPEMDGVELIAQIRKIAPTLPIVMLSGFTETLGLSEENTGANIVLQKSSNEANHLVRAVAKLLDGPPRRTNKSATPPRKSGRARGHSA